METNYRKLLDQMMAPYDEMLQSQIGDHADFSKVDYLEKHSEKYGKMMPIIPIARRFFWLCIIARIEMPRITNRLLEGCSLMRL
ncbi:hypothetical protein PPE_06130 [Paenibacillus polymyxa E681]|nr:hypothetical protein PPE_06130 [Paenibacillus polymyxa E681]